MNYTEKSNMAYPFLPCRPTYVYTYRIFLYTDFENLDVTSRRVTYMWQKMLTLPENLILLLIF